VAVCSFDVDEVRLCSVFSPLRRAPQHSSLVSDGWGHLRAAPACARARLFFDTPTRTHKRMHTLALGMQAGMPAGGMMPNLAHMEQEMAMLEHMINFMQVRGPGDVCVMHGVPKPARTGCMRT